MEKYLVVIEKAPGNYAAYSPDVLGCVATGKTFDKTLTLYKCALESHFRLMAEDGDELPAPQGLQHWINEGEISDTDILAFVEVALPEMSHA
jgi:predicted RNase H-like HicB family nuclease